MADPIFFGSLTDSPDTIGDALARLPPLRAYGQESAGGYGAAYLPRLRATGAGVVQDHVAGAGIATLPDVASFGTNAVVGIAVTYEGYGVAALCALSTYGTDAGNLLPQSGNGLLNLPTLETVGVGFMSSWGSGIVRLQPLVVFGQELSGDWGVARLSGLGTSGAQTIVAPVVYSYLQQPPGYLMSFASTTQLMTVDTAGVSSLTTEHELLYVIRAALSASFTADSKLRMQPDYLLEGVADASIGAAYAMVVETGGIGDLVDDTSVQKALAIADVLAGTLLAESRLSALVNVAAAGVLYDAINNGYGIDLADGGVLLDAIAAKAATLLAINDAAVGDVTAEYQLRISLVVADSGEAVLDPAVAMRARLDLEDGALLYVSLRTGSGDYSGWVMNTDTQAASEYRNYPFDGLVSFKGKHYGYGPAGLVRFEGNTDAGAPIPAHIRTFLMDFGTSLLKGNDDAYIGVTKSGQLVLKTVTFDRKAEKWFEDWYRIDPPAGGSAIGRGKIGRGLQSTWWAYEVHNVNGSDFELEEISFRPILLDRRI